MISPSLQDYIKQILGKKLNKIIHTIRFQQVGGGSINDTYRITVDERSLYFLKVNDAAAFPALFEKEKKGLLYLQQQEVIKAPQVMDCDCIDNYQILILEWVQSSERTENFWKSFGKQLASLHYCSNKSFGFGEDNYMGSVPQSNTPHKDWVSFFIEERLQPLITSCFDKKLLLQKHTTQFEKLFKQLPQIFNEEPPALLHGDLWSGNYMCNTDSEPVLIDPAIYYGHRSVDLGMTTLFGGFRSSFYKAYHYHYPFAANYKEQWQVCNLYPLLIHLLLFGSGYLSSINETLKAFE